jgi:hypothetical protein
MFIPSLRKLKLSRLSMGYHKAPSEFEPADIVHICIVSVITAQLENGNTSSDGRGEHM